MYIAKKHIVFIVLIFVVLGLVGNLIANGTENDPLISKSYLELRIKELKTELDGVKADLAKHLSSHSSVDEGNTSVSAERVFKPLRLDPGSKIFFKEGTEFTMRVGQAKVIDPTGNGLPNLTTGMNLLDGSNLPKNNLFVSPRDDGRGLLCRIEVWLLIKGDYTVTQP